jgi:molybdenum cofactor cytidylyltransferase
LSKKNKVACVILAAGLSKRFGGVKQLARLKEDGPPLVQKALDTANASSAEYVILVLGQAASEIAAETTLGRAALVYNKDFANGLSSSLKCGLSNVPEDSGAVLFMVADQPYLTSGILDEMIDIYG